MSRTGKIAKLPHAIREELNHQLERGVPGRILVAWLNGHPAVQAALNEFFEGKPINEQNLSAWRCGGFADWQTRREFYDQVREVAADAREFEKVAANMAHHASRLLATHFAIGLSELGVPGASSGNTTADSEPCPYAALGARLKPLIAITRTVTALRRSEHESARLQMQKADFALTSESRAVVTGTRPGSASAQREEHSESSQIKVKKTPSITSSITPRKSTVPPVPGALENPSPVSLPFPDKPKFRRPSPHSRQSSQPRSIQVA
jgi:hypothetical protein